MGLPWDVLLDSVWRLTGTNFVSYSQYKFGSGDLETTRCSLLTLNRDGNVAIPFCSTHMSVDSVCFAPVDARADQHY
jgi:hypothetical protein